jgi:4-hydroxyphenylpyruvate dioxygenase
VTTDHALPNQERRAGLDARQLRELVGLVEYDGSTDPFPVTGWDALVWIAGNVTQTAMLLSERYTL